MPDRSRLSRLAGILKIAILAALILTIVGAFLLQAVDCATRGGVLVKGWSGGPACVAAPAP